MTTDEVENAGCLLCDFLINDDFCCNCLKSDLPLPAMKECPLIKRSDDEDMH